VDQGGQIAPVGRPGQSGRPGPGASRLVNGKVIWRVARRLSTSRMPIPSVRPKARRRPSGDQAQRIPHPLEGPPVGEVNTRRAVMRPPSQRPIHRSLFAPPSRRPGAGLPGGEGQAVSPGGPVQPEDVLRAGRLGTGGSARRSSPHRVFSRREEAVRGARENSRMDASGERAKTRPSRSPKRVSGRIREVSPAIRHASRRARKTRVPEMGREATSPPRPTARISGTGSRRRSRCTSWRSTSRPSAHVRRTVTRSIPGSPRRIRRVSPGASRASFRICWGKGRGISSTSSVWVMRVTVITIPGWMGTFSGGVTRSRSRSGMPAWARASRTVGPRT
jgi:hypothetical protein